MDDVILSGTQDSLDPMAVYIPRFQIMFDDTNFKIDMVRACKADRFQRDGLDNSENPWNTYCSQGLDFSVPNVVNKVIKWYTEDKQLNHLLDEKIECERIMFSSDQDEIDIFLFDFHRNELMQRF